MLRETDGVCVFLAGSFDCASVRLAKEERPPSTLSPASVGKATSYDPSHNREGTSDFLKQEQAMNTISELHSPYFLYQSRYLSSLMLQATAHVLLFISPDLLHELDGPLCLIPRRNVVVDDNERLRF